jgi:RimJ/RimL family protein N-acetyltransferase
MACGHQLPVLSRLVWHFDRREGLLGNGYGTEATRLTLEYGFCLLGLHNIMLSVSSANTAAIRAYKRAGFQVIGARREYRREGDYTLDTSSWIASRPSLRH